MYFADVPVKLFYTFPFVLPLTGKDRVKVWENKKRFPLLYTDVAVGLWRALLSAADLTWKVQCNMLSNLIWHFLEILSFV